MPDPRDDEATRSADAVDATELAPTATPASGAVVDAFAWSQEDGSVVPEPVPYVEEPYDQDPGTGRRPVAPAPAPGRRVPSRLPGYALGVGLLVALIAVAGAIYSLSRTDEDETPVAPETSATVVPPAPSSSALPVAPVEPGEPPAPSSEAVAPPPPATTAEPSPEPTTTPPTTTTTTTPPTTTTTTTPPPTTTAPSTTAPSTTAPSSSAEPPTTTVPTPTTVPMTTEYLRIPLVPVPIPIPVPAN